MATGDKTVADDIIHEDELDVRKLDCCHDPHPYPFCCPVCHRIMIYCYEVDALMEDPHDLDREPSQAMNYDDETRPAFHCPTCGYAFEYYFMKNRAYDVPRQAWLDAGLGSLLRDPERRST